MKAKTMIICMELLELYLHDYYKRECRIISSDAYHHSVYVRILVNNPENENEKEKVIEITINDNNTVRISEKGKPYNDLLERDQIRFKKIVEERRRQLYLIDL